MFNLDEQKIIDAFENDLDAEDIARQYPGISADDVQIVIDEYLSGCHPSHPNK